MAKIEFLIQIDERGADRRRVDWLAKGLKNRLGSEPGCSAGYVEIPSSRGAAASRPEVLPAAIAVAATANVRAIALLLRSWVERDRYKRMALTDQRTGRRVDVSRMATDDIAAMLASWRDGDRSV